MVAACVENIVKSITSGDDEIELMPMTRPGMSPGHFVTWCDVSAGMEPAGSPVTDTDGEYSSPDAPRGSGGISLSKRRRCRGR